MIEKLPRDLSLYFDKEKTGSYAIFILDFKCSLKLLSTFTPIRIITLTFTAITTPHLLQVRANTCTLKSYISVLHPLQPLLITGKNIHLYIKLLNTANPLTPIFPLGR